MYRVPYTLDYIYHHPQLPSLSPTHMLIGVDVLTLDAQHPGIVFFSVTTLSLGLPKGNILFLVLVIKLNIWVLKMLSPNHVGFTIFCWSFTLPFLRPLWYIVTMLVLSTYLVILCSTGVPNKLRWTFILFEKK